MDSSLQEEKNPMPIERKAGMAAPPEDGKEKFFPGGAIAFFVCLVILSLIFWYGIYFLMIERS